MVAYGGPHWQSPRLGRAASGLSPIYAVPVAGTAALRRRGSIYRGDEGPGCESIASARSRYVRDPAADFQPPCAFRSWSDTPLMVASVLGPEPRRVKAPPFGIPAGIKTWLRKHFSGALDGHARGSDGVCKRVDVCKHNTICRGVAS